MNFCALDFYKFHKIAPFQLGAGIQSHFVNQLFQIQLLRFLFKFVFVLAKLNKIYDISRSSFTVLLVNNISVASLHQLYIFRSGCSEILLGIVNKLRLTLLNCESEILYFLFLKLALLYVGVPKGIN